MKYNFKPGDKLLYLPTKTPFIIIRVYVTDYGIKYSLANGTPGTPLNGNIRHITDQDIFKNYEPMDEAIRLLYKGD